MDDLISRQAAITAIQNAYCDTEGGEDKYAVRKNVGLTAALHIMQDLQAAQRWIPVTERLPENGTRNLVTRYDYVTDHQFLDLLWFDKGEWWNRRYAGDYAVTHWRELPEPPKEEA